MSYEPSTYLKQRKSQHYFEKKLKVIEYLNDCDNILMHIQNWNFIFIQHYFNWEIALSWITFNNQQKCMHHHLTSW
jgi:hypothetical protein